MIKRSFPAASVLICVAIASGLCTAAPSDCKLLRIAEWPIRLERNKAAAFCWAPTCLLAHTVQIAHSQRKIQAPNRGVLP